MTHLVSFSAVTWDFPLIGRTRMLTQAWLRLGIPTTFVQAPFARTALERAWPWGRSHEPVRIIRPWPTYPRRLWRFVGPRRLRAAIRCRALGLQRQLDRVIDWTGAVAIVVSPLWTPWLDELPFQTVVYDCIDDLTVHVPRAELRGLFESWEAELIARASGAVVTAERLAQRVRACRRDLPLTTIRNGVDADAFMALAASAPRPADVPTGRPVVGFVGALYEWLDWDLILATVRALPELNFVFVGPHRSRGSVASLKRLPNTHLLGYRPYEQVAAYVQACDVCWVPFAPGLVTAAANPVKIYEYLSLGKPVVSTAVADLETFCGLVDVAEHPAEMAARLRQAATNPAADVAARTAFARRNTWDCRARAFVDFVTTLVSP